MKVKKFVGEVDKYRLTSLDRDTLVEIRTEGGSTYTIVRAGRQSIKVNCMSGNREGKTYKGVPKSQRIDVGFLWYGPNIRTSVVTMISIYRR